MAARQTQFLRVPFPRLDADQHAALIAGWSDVALVVGESGSGVTTCAAHRAALLTAVGDVLTRPIPQVLTPTLLRALRVRRMLRDVDRPLNVSSLRSWIVGQVTSIRGRPPEPDETDTLRMATEVALSGRPPIRSVVVDDAQLFADDDLAAVRLITQAPYFSMVTGPGHEGLERVENILDGGAVVELSTRHRSSTSTELARHRWAGLPAPHQPDDGIGPRVLISEPKDELARVAQTWVKNKHLRVALVPFQQDHRRSFADALVRAGIDRRRLFATDVPLSASQRESFGGGGLYILRAEEVGGLEFDELVITSAELLTGDISAAKTRRDLLAMANAVASILTICWNGRGPVPPIIRALKN